MEKLEQAEWPVIEEIELYTRVIQQRYCAAALGGLAPSFMPIGHMSRVLDIGCGTGGWAIDMARAYPHLCVTCIDRPETVLDSEQVHAHWAKTERLSFLSMDILKPLNFRDSSFDFVHVQSSSMLQADDWPLVLQHILPVLRSGGWLQSIAFEMGIASSEAFNELIVLIRQAFCRYLLKQGKTLSSTGSKIDAGAGPYLYGLFIEAGLSNVAYTVHALDLGFGSRPGAREYLEIVFTSLASLKQLVCYTELASSSIYDDLYTRAYQEMMQVGSCGFSYIISVTGCKG